MARQFKQTYDYPVVRTQAGLLRGFELDGTVIFHGVKYADAKRFQAPTPVRPWEGVKDATSYGYVAPLLQVDQPRGEISVPHRYWPMDENCQYLNIWTPTLDPNAKKPVMVWLHGGGFFAGSSIEQVAYDGENLSKFGDVVVISLNHRLNILGYLDLSDYGEKYYNSGNAGNADMVAALTWIHENIAAFGGDPDNVTLFGQSGGGMKVYTLMQTPAADGLFHKGIIMSGVIERMGPQVDDDSHYIVEALLNELQFTDVSQLETVPFDQLAAAYRKVSPEVTAAGHYVGGQPKPNDWYLGDSFAIGFRDHALQIPVMVGSVLSEFLAFGPGTRGRNTMSVEEQEALVRAGYRDAADALLEAFRKAYPNKPVVDLLTMDSMFRMPTSKFIQLKAANDKSATYSYMFTFDFPLDDTKSPWHCSDIPFVFHNSALAPYTNVGPASDLLEEQMSGAWVAFARTGDPNHEGLPFWPASTEGDEATMIFDAPCEVRHNHDHALLPLHAAAELHRPDEEIQIQH